MPTIQRIAPCLWFDRRAEEAVAFYTGIFPNSRILTVTHYTEAGREFHGMPAGTVMTVAFELDGLLFTALNGGPMFRFTEAVSLQVFCDTQEEVDLYWARLLEGEGATEQACGWLKDRFGLSWQVLPVELYDLLQGPDPAAIQRTTAALLQMVKLDLAALKRAHAGD